MDIWETFISSHKYPRQQKQRDIKWLIVFDLDGREQNGNDKWTWSWITGNSLAIFRTPLYIYYIMGYNSNRNLPLLTLLKQVMITLPTQEHALKKRKQIDLSETVQVSIDICWPLEAESAKISKKYLKHVSPTRLRKRRFTSVTTTKYEMHTICGIK